MIKYGPVPVGWASWASWSSPPYSENPNPDVLSSSENVLTMKLSHPVKTFDFELEPNPFETFTYTADFYQGATLIESITRDINGVGGARLLARSGQPINRVVVIGGAEFTIAQVCIN